MNRKLIILFLVFTNTYLFSQDQPKIGTIVFESCKFLGNKHLKLSESKRKEKREKIRDFVKKNIDTKKPDEFINSMPKSELEVYGDSMRCTYKLDIYNHFYESMTKCDYIKESDTEMYEQINRENFEANTIIRKKKINQYEILRKRKITLSRIPDKYELVEYRNETKNILGYKCFKVIMRNKKKQNESRLIIYDFEMYVTEDISINYSPISRYKEILEKYYPLEIIKKPRKEVMAEVIEWKVKTINLKE